MDRFDRIFQLHKILRAARLPVSGKALLEKLECSRPTLHDKPALEKSEKQLNEHFATAYGIFAGKPKDIAVLRFTPECARWVADEQWHPEQESHVLPDGIYELRIPYSDPRELVMDILKYGPEVEVVGPQALRDEVRGRLRMAVSLYEEKED